MNSKKTSYEKMQEKVEAAHKQVVDEVLKLMQKSGQTWLKDWAINFAVPVNASTKNRYTGKNLLNLISKYQFGGYMTFNQAKELGYFPRKGERSEIVEHWTRRKFAMNIAGQLRRLKEDEGPEAGEVEKWLPCLDGVYHVFNVSQLADEEGNAHPDVKEPVKRYTDNDELEKIADRLIASSRCEVRQNHETSNYYTPTGDYISMTRREYFETLAGFIAALAHEMTHSTALELGRDLVRGSKTKSYAFEELVAELGAAFICTELNVSYEPDKSASHDLESHAAYLQSWINKLDEDQEYLYKAAVLADEAARFILDRYENCENMESVA